MEFPNGQILKLTQLAPGQTATVLQLPVAAQHPEHVETGHVTRSADSRVALNRVPLRPGMASILMPNQGAVMLWQIVRSTAVSLSAALVQSFCRSKARTADVGAEIQTGFSSDLLLVMLPKRPPAQKPEKKVKLEATA